MSVQLAQLVLLEQAGLAQLELQAKQAMTVQLAPLVQLAQA